MSHNEILYFIFHNCDFKWQLWPHISQMWIFHHLIMWLYNISYLAILHCDLISLLQLHISPYLIIEPAGHMLHIKILLIILFISHNVTLLFSQLQLDTRNRDFSDLMLSFSQLWLYTLNFTSQWPFFMRLLFLTTVWYGALWINELAS